MKKSFWFGDKVIAPKINNVHLVILNSTTILFKAQSYGFFSVH